MFRRSADKPFFRFENKTHPRKLQPLRHDHDNFEIYLLDKGSCSYFVENTVYQVEAGDFMLLPPHTLHKVKYKEDAYERRVIWCAPQYVPEELLAQAQTPLYLRRNAAALPEIIAIFNRIEREIECADEYTEQVLAHYMSLLFYTLTRSVDRTATVQQGNTYVLQAVRYIGEHYDSEVRLLDVACEVAISPEHLSRLFKKETGFGFSEYLNALRLQKAEKLLREKPGECITAVAFSCGFNDSNYFCERFKRVYGCSPMQYRRNVRKG